MKNIHLRKLTKSDIDTQVLKIIKGLGNPEPPMDLRLVRELLKLDRGYYSSSNDGLLREVANKLLVAGIQIFKRPGLVRDAVRQFNLRALYLPDRKRILLDEDVPVLKHRWNEAHEISHDIIPWHAGMMHGNTEQTLTPACHLQIEAEANYGAGQILFLSDRFVSEASDLKSSIGSVLALKERFGNTITSTLWRFVEQVRPDIPMVALVTPHPHPSRRSATFDPANPCRYCVQSLSFAQRFQDVSECALFDVLVTYCNSGRRGYLGQSDVILEDDEGDRHIFHFETFFNSYEALTLGVYGKPYTKVYRGITNFAA